MSTCTKRRRLGAWAACLVAAALVVPVARGQEPVRRPGEGAAGPAFTAKFGSAAVAADHPMASLAGARVLEQGGNAVDAAVATSFALSVVRPFSCGIGGGGFMVIHLPKGKDGKPVTAALNYRETAPAWASAEAYARLEKTDPKASVTGGRAVAVPGTVAGLLEAHGKYGRLSREKVLAPAIALAREGFAVDVAYVGAVGDAVARLDGIADFQTRFAFVWTRFVGVGEGEGEGGGAGKAGVPLKVGDVLKLPEQAAALELIAKEGAKAFYSGAIGEAIVRAVREDLKRAVPGAGGAGGAGGGGLTLNAGDLKGYRPVWVEPLRFEAFGRGFVAMPPPSSGGVAMAQTLGILALTDFGTFVKGDGTSMHPMGVHLTVEAFKHAFADRAEWLGDPAFGEVPLARLLSGEYLRERAARVRQNGTGAPDQYGTRRDGGAGSAPPNDGGTSHLCVVDAEGGAVACTETINLSFGSLLAVPEYGFCLNNEMDDFTTRPGKPNAFGLVQSARNAPQKGKRPLSSMSPTIVLDKEGKVEAVAGASGGPRIITATTQVLMNALVLGFSPGQAVSRPRFHHQWMPAVLEFEAEYLGRHEGMPTPVWMKKLHHQVEEAKSGAAVQLIVRGKGGGWEAACDPRKGGAPAGR